MVDKSDKSQLHVKVREVVIGDEHAGQRIDNFLLTALKGVPKTHIYKLLRKGEVRVNKGRIKPPHRLQEGDVVRIPPVRVAEPKPDAPVSSKLHQQLQDRIIFEDKDLLVINKPSGLAVHGGSGLNFGLIEALRQMYPLAKRLELVHRLDRDTSGCLIIAKKASILKALHEQLRNDGMEKIYLALAKGTMKGRQEVDAPLLKNTVQSGERVVRVNPEGKEAQTIFTSQRVFENSTLLEARLITGRTHQIRVHAKHMGHPLAGDDKYGDDDFNKHMASNACSCMRVHCVLPIRVRVR
jgi:23S rRNA pseudouridine955/2504/2580 synthase